MKKIMKKRTQYLKNLICIMILLCAITSPINVKAATNVVKSLPDKMGGSHSGVIKADGSLWMWGTNGAGQLGTGDTASSLVPVKVLENVTDVSLGQSHSAAIKSDGSLWVWGSNTDGELGTGDTTSNLVPVKVLENVVDISLGQMCSAAIKSDGSLWMWGYNYYGRLGNGATEDSLIPIKVLENVVSVSLSDDYCSAAVKSDGSLWMWGSNNNRQFGTGDTVGSTVPKKVLDDVAFVSLGTDHTAVIKTNGALWCWGKNDAGQLGNGTEELSAVPVKIMDNVRYVSTHYRKTAVIKTDGSLWTWGGYTGDGTGIRSAVPIKIMDSVISVSGGYNHRAVIKSDGSLWMWGTNWYGELGVGDTGGGCNAPTVVIAPSYTITYQANGGINAPSEQTKEYGENITLRLAEPTRKGYTFLGWSESATATTADYQPEDIYTKEQDAVLYAVWEANTYTISYNANGGINAPTNQSQKYGTNLKLSDGKPTRAGYTFQGWSESATAASAAYQSSGNYLVEDNATLYAVWKLNTYTVSYDANGGINAPAKQIKSHGTGLKLSSSIPTKTGYTFVGWAETKSAANAAYQSSGTYTTEKNVTLYAVWKVNQYTVSYDVNGGIGTIESQTRDYGTNLKLSSTIPVRTGYTFLGWAESSTAETAAYLSAGNYIVKKDVTLYAVWQVTTYTVSYNNNGGSGTISEQIKKHDVALVLTNAKPVKEGYVFKGWSADAKSSAVNYQAGGNYTMNEDVVLYAVWEKEKIIAQKQTISVKNNITKEYKKNSKFKLGATAKTKLTYQSTNKKVAAVSKKGVVTIKGYGNAKIKITAAATEYYKKASKTVKISIVPAKMTGLKVTSSEKGVLLFNWKKNKQMNGYEIQFSTSKKFSANKTMRGTLPANSTYTRTKNLKSGKTYYARIRGYRKVKGIQVYGLWSDVKKIKIK